MLKKENEALKLELLNLKLNPISLIKPNDRIQNL